MIQRARLNLFTVRKTIRDGGSTALYAAKTLFTPFTLLKVLKLCHTV